MTPTKHVLFLTLLGLAGAVRPHTFFSAQVVLVTFATATILALRTKVHFYASSCLVAYFGTFAFTHVTCIVLYSLSDLWLAIQSEVRKNEVKPFFSQDDG